MVVGLAGAQCWLEGRGGGRARSVAFVVVGAVWVVFRGAKVVVFSGSFYC
jgi:hypothetical protein